MVILLCKSYLNYHSWIGNLSRYAIVFLGSQYFLVRPFARFVSKLGINGTIVCDIAIFVVTAVYVSALPKCYEKLKTHIPAIKILNGEY